MNELITTSQAVQLSGHIQTGLILDRAQVKKLLRQLEKFGAEVVGGDMIQAQLRGILDRRDWITISIAAASPASARAGGVHIGIVRSKSVPTKTRLSPMQKWQRKNGLDRRSE